MKILPQPLMQTVPNLKAERAAFIADKMNFVLPGYGINSFDIFHEFLANIAHESGGFRVKEENLNYTAPRLMAIWPSRFKNIGQATIYAHNPRQIANFVYNGRMGNKKGSDDGYNFRGGGFIQLTGRDMYEKYRKFTGFNDIVALAEAVRKDDYYALDSAAWLFAVEKKLIPLAVSDDLTTIVKRINGGLIGLTDRTEYYNRAKKYFVE